MNQTPLCDALRRFAGQRPLRMHMPGHKGRFLPLPELSPAAALDVTELPPTGNLFESGGPIEAAENLWASAFGSAHCLFLTGGSTQGVLSAFTLACRPGDQVLVDRGCHRSAFNAMALLVGAQVGRPGVMTQCALEEATELQLGMRGFTTYAETISVYGTEPVFMDGDDTPYSKAFLASCYASRGLKMRFTSGTGSEVQMGYAEGKSMLYLEARCLAVTKGAGVQGTQNGSVSCIGVPAGVPGGIRAVAAENLIAMLLDLESTTSNDQTFTHSDLRRVARTVPQLFSGTDYICSGYSATPNYDNMFAGSNWDAEDYDDWTIIQRDMKIDGGLQPVREEDVLKARNKAARALQGMFRELGLPEITDAEVEAATYANGSNDMPERNVNEDLKAIEDMMARKVTGVDFVKALDRAGFPDVAHNIYNMLRQKVAGDYLHTASIFDEQFHVLSAVNVPNEYHGPMTGYQISEERWNQLKNIPNAIRPEDI